MADTQLEGMNQLLQDVYGSDLDLGELLADDLDEDQMKRVRTEEIDQLLRLVAFGIACQYAILPYGTVRASALLSYYGLNTPGPLPPPQGEDLRREVDKALRWIKPNDRQDILGKIIHLAAWEILGTGDNVRPGERPPQPLPGRSRQRPPRPKDGSVLLRELHHAVNEIRGCSRGERGYVRRNEIANWLVEQGYLRVRINSRGYKIMIPTEAGWDIGIRGMGERQPINRYYGQAQRIVLDHFAPAGKWAKTHPAHREETWTRQMDDRLEALFMAGLSLKEIAEKMECSQAAIRAHLNKWINL